MPKPVGESLMRNRICVSSQSIFPQSSHSFTKGKTLPLSWRNLADIMLITWSKFTSAVTDQTSCALCHDAQRTHLIYVVFLPKMHHLNLISRKHQTHPKWATMHKTKSFCYKKCQGHRRQRLRNCPRQQTEGDETTTYKLQSWMGYWTRKKKNAIKNVIRTK